MDWIESVRELRKVKSENRLVIFVGSGISRNSNIPLWGELISDMAEYINYSRCIACKKKTKRCDSEKCKLSNDFSFDEYLRIPEYFYDIDDSDNKEKYFAFVRNAICKKAPSNSLDKIILDVLPHHIITTNYDYLLEEAESINTSRYKVIKDDKQLLSDQHEHYIVKMHGSLDDIENIVLKESDYIDYENRHPLICTMIKALLIDHSFLFLGYSLNDYNLRLIMGWINYFRKFHGVEGIKHYLFTTGLINKYEEKRLEESNVIVIDGDRISEGIISDAIVPEDLTNNVAKKIYAYLKCINDTSLWKKVCGLGGILDEVYDLYNSYNKIALVDLKNTLPMGRVELYKDVLVFYDKSFYNVYKEYLKTNGKLRDLFRKTHIVAIKFVGLLNENEEYYYEFEKIDYDFGEAFADAVMNDYKSVYSKINKSKNIAERIYYYKILDDNKLSSELKKKIKYSDYVDYVLWKMRIRVASLSLYDRQEEITKELREIFLDKQPEYSRCIYQLEDLFGSTSHEPEHMRKLLLEVEQRFGIGFNGAKTSKAYTEILLMQGYVYNYYYFFKLNFLPLDVFDDPVSYFESYIKAMLCTYFKGKNERNMPFESEREEYVLNEIDYDIITKYTNPSSLNKWLKQYSVKNIKFNPDLESLCYDKFENICKSFIVFKNDRFMKYIHSSILVLMNSEISDKRRIVKDYFGFVKRLPLDSKNGEKALDIMIYILRNNNLDKTLKNKILQYYLKDEVYDVFMKRYSWLYEEIISLLSESIGQYKSNSLYNKLISDDDSEKIYRLRSLLPKRKVNLYLERNSIRYNVHQLTILFFEQRITYNMQIQKKYISSIENANPAPNGVRIFPDQFSRLINDYLLLDLLGIDNDLSLIFKYRNVSDFIKFVMDPDKFDYSCVDIRNYMWQNYIYSNKYKGYFIKHKEELLDEEVRALLTNGNTEKELQKVVYGVLLNDSELRRF